MKSKSRVNVKSGRLERVACARCGRWSRTVSYRPVQVYSPGAEYLGVEFLCPKCDCGSSSLTLGDWAAL